MNQLNEIQRLRGVACLLVLCQHVCCVVPLVYFIGNIPACFQYASCGVHMFFVISGFVISISMKDKLEKCCISDDFAERLYAAKNELKVFFTKRFFRLMPVFIVSVFLIIFFQFCIECDHEKKTQSCRLFADVISSFYNDVASKLGYSEKIHYAGSGLYWTLSLEIFFYIIWPILFLALKNNSIRVKASLLVGVSLWACARWIMSDVLKMPQYVYYSTFTNMDGLFLGTFIGLMYRKQESQTSQSSIWCIASIIIVFLMWTHPNLYNSRTLFTLSWQNVSVFFSCILVALAAYEKGVFNIPVLRNFLEYLGSRSYSFYIYQMFLAYAVKWLCTSRYCKLSGDVDFKIAMIFLVLLFVITELSYRFIEEPFRKIGNKIASSYK